MATLLLFANVRATFLARRWQREETASEISELPERTTSSLGDKLANVLPEKVWPKARYAFYPLALIVILMSILSIVGLPKIKAKQAAAAADNPVTIQVQALR